MSAGLYYLGSNSPKYCHVWFPRKVIDINLVTNTILVETETENNLMVSAIVHCGLQVGIGASASGEGSLTWLPVLRTTLVFTHLAWWLDSGPGFLALQRLFGNPDSLNSLSLVRARPQGMLEDVSVKRGV